MSIENITIHSLFEQNRKSRVISTNHPTFTRVESRVFQVVWNNHSVWNEFIGTRFVPIIRSIISSHPLFCEFLETDVHLSIYLSIYLHYLSTICLFIFYLSDCLSLDGLRVFKIHLTILCSYTIFHWPTNKSWPNSPSRKDFSTVNFTSESPSFYGRYTSNTFSQDLPFFSTIFLVSPSQTKSSSSLSFF